MKNFNDSGFTLIELCICMTIATIIVGMGYGTYQKQHHEISRKNAELYLQDIAINLQEHEDPKTGYANLNLAQLGFPDTREDYHYELISSINGFLISAEPEFQDTCGTLSIDQNGRHLNTGDSHADCWH